MSEAARLLGVSRQRVYQLVNMGFLHVVGRGRNRRIPLEAVKDRKAAKLRLLGKCMTTNDVAAHFGVNPKTVRIWRDLGLLHSTKINNLLCFDPDEVKAFDPPGHKLRRLRGEDTNPEGKPIGNINPEEA